MGEYVIQIWNYSFVSRSCLDDFEKDEVYFFPKLKIFNVQFIKLLFN